MTLFSTETAHRWRRAAGLGGLALLLVTLAACQWVQTRVRPASGAVPHLVWPEPPDPPRVELLAVFARPSDLGIERSIWRRLASLISGDGETQMVRPTGIAAAGTQLAVADPGAGVVQILDLARHDALALTACGETSFGEPVAVAFLADHTYVADAGQGRIFFFTADGACAGSWRLADGSRPAGLAADPTRARLYVADAGAHQVLGFDPQGTEVLRFGSRGVGPGEFNYPTWLATDTDGNLFVTDALNFRVQIFDPSGTPLAQFGSHGDSSGEVARPKGVGVDRDGHIYLVDALFDAVQIFDREGHYLMVFGGRGVEPGSFWLPSGVAVAGDRIYVADSYNRRVQVFRFLGSGS